MTKKLILIGIIVLSLSSLGAYQFLRPRATGITATGAIEITRVDITPKVGGYLRELNLNPGDTVTAGQVAARIDRPDLKIQLLRDEASLERAQAQLRDLADGSRTQERGEAQAALDSARALYENAKSDYERLKILYQQEAVSLQQLDAARAALKVAANNVATAQQRVSLVTEGSRKETLQAQQKEVERNRAILQASRVMLDDTVVNVPQQGIVISKNYENGEFVNPGAPIYTIGNYADCWVKIYIPSTQLGLIKVGQTAQVKIDSYPDRIFKGVIKEISQSAEYTPRQSITPKERANLVFGVKVQLANPEQILKPGMPADVVLK